MFIAMIMLRALATTGAMMVLSHHMDMAFWEGSILCFWWMLFFAGNNIRTLDEDYDA